MTITYQDQGAVRVATDACIGENMRVLQLYQCGGEPAHIDYLLDVMAPPADAVIVDVGCGIGRVACLIRDRRPDVGFLLLNLSEYQLSLCPEDMRRIQADMHDTQLRDACADVVMVNYTLGYADFDIFFAEAFRILQPGGILFIYDLSCRVAATEPCALMQQKFHYQVLSPDAVVEKARARGFTLDRIDFPPATRTHLEPLLDDEYRAALDQIDAQVQPTAWRFLKDSV